jgi:hypothetical protein
VHAGLVVGDEHGLVAHQVVAGAEPDPVVSQAKPWPSQAASLPTAVTSTAMRPLAAAEALCAGARVEEFAGAGLDPDLAARLTVLERRAEAAARA